MLQSQTVAKPTLDLLNKLMALPALDNFALVGGRINAIVLGHRISVDLYMFTNSLFDTNDLLPVLFREFPNMLIGSQKVTSLLCWINDIKVDIILHEYPYIKPIETIEGIRLVSVPDVIAMKLNAIAQRGAQKDFWDLAYLLDEYSIEEMIGFYKFKYKAHDVFHVVRSLTYFDDAENKNLYTVMPLKTITWDEIKTKIEHAVNQYLKSKL